MHKLSKFQKVQLCLSVIPFYSTIFVVIVTMIALKKKKATWKAWGCLFLIMAFAMFLYSAIGTHISYERSPVANVLIAAVIFAAANAALVFLQAFSQTGGQIFDNKNLTILLAIVPYVLAVILVGIILLNDYLNPEFTHIEDINGSDHSLAVITMEDILATRNAGILSQGGDGYQGNSSMVDEPYAIFDYDVKRLHYKKVSGIFTLQATKVKVDTLSLLVDTDLTAGNAELLVFIDDQYYQHIPTEKNQEVILENISEKTVVVKLAAESAEIRLTISRVY